MPNPAMASPPLILTRSAWFETPEWQGNEGLRRIDFFYNQPSYINDCTESYAQDANVALHVVAPHASSPLTLPVHKSGITGIMGNVKKGEISASERNNG